MVSIRASGARLRQALLSSVSLLVMASIAVDHPADAQTYTFNGSTQGAFLPIEGYTNYVNNGTIGSNPYTAVGNSSGYSGTLTNNGTITSGGYGISNYGQVIYNCCAVYTYIGTIAQINNNATIYGGAAGIYNHGQILQNIVNAGTISGGIGVQNVTTGIISSTSFMNLTNTGTISGTNYSVYSQGGFEQIGSITNGGLISGTVYVAGQSLQINGGSGGAIGTFTGGGINVPNGNLIFQGGPLFLNFASGGSISVSGGAGTVSNSGTLQVNAQQTITGNYVQYGRLNVNVAGGQPGVTYVSGLSITGSATLQNSATVNLGQVGSGLIIVGNQYVVAQSPQPITLLTTQASGSVAGFGFGGQLSLGSSGGLYQVIVNVTSGTAGMVTNANYVSIQNNGTISGTTYGAYNFGSIGTLSNNGKLLANITGLYNSGTIGTILNNSAGTISGGQGKYGIQNDNSIVSLSNYGTISSQSDGLYNGGSIGALNNFNTGTITGGNGTFGVYNSGTVGSVVNNGMIGSGGTGFFNSGLVRGISNTGTISGGSGKYGIYNSGGRITGGVTGVSNTAQISTLTNTGVISGTSYGVNNSSAVGSISSLINLAGGTITGTNTGIYNTGSIGTLSNSGLITGSVNAINSVYQLANILNSGTIKGNISAFPATSAPYQTYVTITGATTGAMGTLTGFGTTSTSIVSGTINTVPPGAFSVPVGGNLTFVQNTLLEDDVVLPSSSTSGVGKAVNFGQITLVQPQTIYGNFQNDGTVVFNGQILAPGQAPLTVTGQWTDPPASSTGTVLIQAGLGDASPLGTQVIAQTAVPIDAAMATVGGIGYSVANVRTLAGPGGSYLLVGDVARTDFNFSQDGSLVVQNLAGSRAVVQSGSGSTYLVGQNGYTGPTRVTGGVLGIVGTSASPSYAVSGGTLRIDGIASGVVSVAQGGTLAGSGSFAGGTIGVGGVLAPANIAAVAALSLASAPAQPDAAAVATALGVQAPYAQGVAVNLSNAAGNFVSNGNLTLGSGATYRVGVTASGLSDHLVVAGQLNVQGAAVDVRPLPGGYSLKTSYTIAAASGGVLGSFARVTSDLAFLTPTLSYDANDVFLTLRRNDVDYTAVAATQNQVAVAAGLRGAFAQGISPAGGAVIDYFTQSSTSQAQAFLNQSSGEGIATAQTATYAVVSLFGDATRDRAMDWVMGEMPTPWTPQITSTDPASGTKPQERRLRAWATALGGGANLGGVSGVGSASASTSGGGGVAGIDYQINQDFLVGVAAGGTSATYTVGQRNTSGRQTGGMGGLYGVARLENFYALGLLSYGGFSTRSSRSVMGLSGMESEIGTLSSNAYTARMELGYRIANPAVNVTPYIALQGTSLQSAGFTETSMTGAGQPGSLGLKVGGHTTNSVPGAIGFQLDRAFTSGDDWIVRPVLRLAWSHEFSTSRSISAGLAALPGSAWTIQGTSAAPDAADIAMSLQALNRNGISISAQAAAYAAPRTSAYQGQLAISYRW